MGKMPLGGQQRGRGRDGRALEGGIELQQLLIREGQEEALEKDDGFAEAGIEVVMGGVEQVPFAFGLQGGTVVQLFPGFAKGFAEILDEFQQGRDFMKKLRTLAEKNAAAYCIETRGAAALRLLKIFGIERTEIGDDAKMFGMN